MILIVARLRDSWILSHLEPGINPADIYTNTVSGASGDRLPGRGEKGAGGEAGRPRET